ncbi:MAG: Holliday junction resolvase RuvX [Candidatus Eisenbacteria bacterium]|nr:Holliday junction resolvase RuvX [Candidatus Eisenbacteria bacterium]
MSPSSTFPHPPRGGARAAARSSVLTRGADHAPGRVLALDVGLRRTGIAISDPQRRLATPLETVSLQLRALIAHLRRRIDEYEVSLVLIGHPELRSGRATAPARLAEEIARRLRAGSGVAVRYWGETLTSWEAESLLQDASRRARRRPARRRRTKEAIDRVAASLILQDFLDSQGGPAPPAGEAE